jgi:hypothetical protein
MRQEDTGRGGGGGGGEWGVKRDQKRGVGRWGSDADESDFIEILKRIQNSTKKREQFLSNTLGRRQQPRVAGVRVIGRQGRGCENHLWGRRPGELGPGSRCKGGVTERVYRPITESSGCKKGGGGRESKDRVA